MTQSSIQQETGAKGSLASDLSLPNLRYPLIFKTPPILHLEAKEIPPCCSKAAANLSKNVLKAIADLKPIIFQAPPGSGKTFMAGFIHSQSNLKNTVFVEVDCSQLPRDEEQHPILDELLGTVTIPGALDSLQQGTLLIDNVHLLTPQDSDRLLKIIQNKISHGHQIRFILASPHPFPTPNLDVHPIKLFSLVQRREDIASFANYFLKRICQKHNRPLLSLSQVALRRLLSYDYPRNLVELEIILIRAVLMTPPTETSISEQALWSVQSKKNRFRVDLLTYVP
ncbi:MAG: sigma 54-interacting transcriptional regulator [Microcystaceae cyanobacterium]